MLTISQLPLCTILGPKHTPEEAGRRHLPAVDVLTLAPADGSFVVFGPVYSRSGFGLLARTCAFALHAAGKRVCVVPVDCEDAKMTGDLDDCDIYLLRTMEQTEVRAPVTAVYAYVPTYIWPRMKLPEPSVRIMVTTYDASAEAKSVPHRLIYICNEMDQIWVANQSEEAAWIRSGAKPECVRSFNLPIDWIDNPILGAPHFNTGRLGKTFRFLHVSMFLPRRRLDVLIQAFHEEFREESEAELYLKVTYPRWHPVADQPRKDLKDLIETSQARTGSKAKVIVDETLGTRKELAQLYDSCDFYVSLDTNSTAPVAEALSRGRLAIIADLGNFQLPPELIVVKNSHRQVAITPVMELYQPHQRGGTFSALEVADVRAALRRAKSLPQEERNLLALSALEWMRSQFSYASTTAVMLANVGEAWQANAERKKNSPAAGMAPTAKSPGVIAWCGLQLFHGKIPAINRSLSYGLIARGHTISLQPSNGPFHIDELLLEARPQYRELADRFFVPPAAKLAVSISSRWDPIFGEQVAARQVMVSTWWSGAIPAEWTQKIHQFVHEVWVPSRHVRDNFIQGGIAAEKVWVMPVGVDTTLFRPGAPARPLKTKKSFKFLFVGETSQRKGIDLLVKAYAAAFTSRDDVCLVIKDMSCSEYYGYNLIADFIRQYQGVVGRPEIEYLSTMLGEEEMPSLYAACDCFVQPFRTASFNLAALEAMACGLPVIATDYAGAREMCDAQVSYLLKAREIHRKQDFVGHSRVTGQQRHAEIDLGELMEKMRHVVKYTAEARARGALARQKVCSQFDTTKQAEIVEARLRQVAQLPATTARTVAIASGPGAASSVGQLDVMPWLGLKKWVRSLLVVAPFYNRSGYATAARAVVAGMRAAGIPVRIMSVDGVEEGIDDCDMAALKALEQTPVQLPLAAVFIHVPHQSWLDLTLPKDCVRILFTTFDGSAQGGKPPPAWVKICQAMDQIWLMTPKEATVFELSGITAGRIKVMSCPHPWINNPLLPLPVVKQETPPAKFRFLTMAMFQPRRRWDTMIEAFLTEFSQEENVELYIKVNYPSWHPVPGQPQRDLQQLIAAQQEKTQSRAKVIVDEELGSRQSICRIVDSCHAYVSTDTTSTAPLSEALVRGKIAVVPDGYGARLPDQSIITIPVDPRLKGPITPEMLLYQPHHKGQEMPLLRVDDVRRAMRQALEIPAEQRTAMGQSASLFMETNFSPTNTTPPMLREIQVAFARKFHQAAVTSSVPAPITVHWMGSFLNYGSLALVNRELTAQLLQRPNLRLTCASTEHLAAGAKVPADLQALAQRLCTKAPENPTITVRHQWPPDWNRPKQGALVIIQPWEFGVLPIDWVRQSTQVEEFWVPSTYVRDVYVNSGVAADKVKVVPNGIDPAQFHPAAAPLALATRKSFKFLFLGGTIHRKGPDLLLQAYLENFTAADDVCLVIKDFGGKSVYAGQTLEAQIFAARAKPKAPEIIYLNEELAPEAIPGVYTACDCFVYPYRGEGFGLPILEAMACGLPVVITAGGSADDFAPDEFAYRIPAVRKSIRDSISGIKLVAPGWLLEPDASALAERMKWIVAHREESRALGALASAHARSQWTWERAAVVAERNLESLAAQKSESVPFSKPVVAPRKPASILRPSVAQLGQLTQAQELFRQKNPRAAWESVREAIRIRPHHPEAFLLLSEIALMVNDAGSAILCAQHAQILAPAFQAPKKFLQGNLYGNTKPKWLVLPPEIENRRQKAKNRLSVCVIVKNEEEFIGQCLASIKAVADQIVVVDTGSTDRTTVIAREYGAEIYEFTWRDDFSAARNAALAHATGEWVLSLDADEELPPGSQESLRLLLADDAVMGWRLPLFDVGREEDGKIYVPRLFRNAPGLFWIGRVHEQVFYSFEVLRKEWGLDNRIGDAALRHYGFTNELMDERGTLQRNLNLLELAINETPDDTWLLMNYGLEQICSKRLDEGLRQYQSAVNLMSTRPASTVVPERLEALLMQYCTHLRAAKRPAEIVTLLSLPLAQMVEFTASLHFRLGLAHWELRQYPAAAAEMRQCLAKRGKPTTTPVDGEVNTVTPRHYLALALWYGKNPEAAAEEFQAAIAEVPSAATVQVDYANFLNSRGKTADALQALYLFTSANPAAVDGWRAGSLIALSDPALLEVAVNWTAVAFAHHPDDANVITQRAEALMLSGALQDALTLWTRENGDTTSRARSARILCEIALGIEVGDSKALLVEEVNREFLLWCSRLVKFGAEPVILQLHANSGALEVFLPGALSVILSTISKIAENKI